MVDITASFVYRKLPMSLSFNLSPRWPFWLEYCSFYSQSSALYLKSEKIGDSVSSFPEALSSTGIMHPQIYIFLISVSLLEKRCWKWWAMLKSCQHVPSTIYMQISAAIMETSILTISANVALKWTNKVSEPMFWGSGISLELFLKWPHHAGVKMSFTVTI